MAAKKIKFCILASLGFCLAGSLLAYSVFSDAVGKGWELMTYSSSLATFILALTLSLLFISQRERVGWWRSILIGAAIGTLSHPLAWYLAILYRYFLAGLANSGGPPAGPIEAIPGVLALSVFSLLGVGWISLSVGVILGILFFRFLFNRFCGE